MVNICLPVVVIRRMKPYATHAPADQHARRAHSSAGAKMTQKVTNINLTGQRNTGFQNKRKSTVLYTTTSLSNFGVSKYTPFIIVKMHKNANFLKTIFKVI